MFAWKRPVDLIIPVARGISGAHFVSIRIAIKDVKAASKQAGQLLGDAHLNESRIRLNVPGQTMQIAIGEVGIGQKFG